MRHAVVRLLVALVPLPLVAQQPDEATRRQLKEELWPRAYREGDPALLDRILADEFQGVGPDGAWSSKGQELERVSRTRMVNKSFRFAIRRREVLGNATAVVAGRGGSGVRPIAAAATSASPPTRSSSGRGTGRRSPHRCQASGRGRGRESRAAAPSGTQIRRCTVAAVRRPNSPGASPTSFRNSRTR